MKILTITANDNSIGGASRIAMDIHHGLLMRGHESFVFAGKSEGMSVDSRIQQIRRPLWTKILSKLLSNDIDFFQTNYLLETPEFLAADVIHCHNIHGWYFSLRTLREMATKKPVLWTLHDMWSVTPHAAHTSSKKMRNGIYQISDQSLYPSTIWNNDLYLSWRKNMLYRDMSINLVSPSIWLMEKIKKTCLSSKRIFHIPNGVDFEKFKMGPKCTLREKYGFSSKPLILFVGADPENNIYKGYTDFLKLVHVVGETSAQYVCLGSKTSGYREGVRHLLATSDKSYIAEILSCADILVCTSRYENFPLTLLEAMACGVSVLTYKVGGASEAIEGAPNCIAVDPSDPILLAQSLQKMIKKILIGGACLRDELRSYAYKKYDINLMIDAYVKAYEQLASK